jgi:hypothetical protein
MSVAEHPYENDAAPVLAPNENTALVHSSGYTLLYIMPKFTILLKLKRFSRENGKEKINPLGICCLKGKFHETNEASGWVYWVYHNS